MSFKTKTAELLLALNLTGPFVAKIEAQSYPGAGNQQPSYPQQQQSYPQQQQPYPQQPVYQGQQQQQPDQDAPPPGVDPKIWQNPIYKAGFWKGMEIANQQQNYPQQPQPAYPQQLPPPNPYYGAGGAPIAPFIGVGGFVEPVCLVPTVIGRAGPFIFTGALPGSCYLPTLVGNFGYGIDPFGRLRVFEGDRFDPGFRRFEAPRGTRFEEFHGGYVHGRQIPEAAVAEHRAREQHVAVAHGNTVLQGNGFHPVGQGQPYNHGQFSGTATTPNQSVPHNTTPTGQSHGYGAYPAPHGANAPMPPANVPHTNGTVTPQNPHTYAPLPQTHPAPPPAAQIRQYHARPAASPPVHADKPK